MRRRLRSLAGLASILGVVGGVAIGARAHTIPPEAVLAKIGSQPVRDAYGVTAVERSADVPRLLIVRVGPQWNRVPEAQRQDAALEWQLLWRHTVAQGIVAVLDTTTGAVVVKFDAEGHAVVKDVGAGS